MPSTLSGLLVVAYSLIPGSCYYAVRRRMAPTRRVSTVVEAANVIVVAMVTNAIVLMLYGILQVLPWIRDHCPSVVELLRDPRAYLLHDSSRLVYVGAWAIGLLVGSTTLAVASALRIGIGNQLLPSRLIRKITARGPLAMLASVPPIQGLMRHCCERISAAKRIAHESVWDHFFSAVAPDNCVIYVECYMHDGSYAAGSLSWYNDDIDDTQDRDLALGQPLLLASADSTELVEPGFDQIAVISAHDIRQVVISYIEVSAIEAERKRRSTTDTDSTG